MQGRYELFLEFLSLRSDKDRIGSEVISRDPIPAILAQLVNISMNSHHRKYHIHSKGFNASKQGLFLENPPYYTMSVETERTRTLILILSKTFVLKIVNNNNINNNNNNNNNNKKKSNIKNRQQINNTSTLYKILNKTNFILIF